VTGERPPIVLCHSGRARTASLPVRCNQSTLTCGSGQRMGHTDAATMIRPLSLLRPMHTPPAHGVTERSSLSWLALPC